MIELGRFVDKSDILHILDKPDILCTLHIQDKLGILEALTNNKLKFFLRH